jgi:hypothetical protein
MSMIRVQSDDANKFHVRDTRAIAKNDESNDQHIVFFRCVQRGCVSSMMDVCAAHGDKAAVKVVFMHFPVMAAKRNAHSRIWLV